MDNSGFVIPPSLYNFLKFIALVLLPAAAALVITLGTILGWSGATVTAGVITAVDTFMGLILGKSSSNFKNSDPENVGDLVFGTDETGGTFVKRVQINKENPVFNVGGRLNLNVVREVDQP